MKIKVWRQDKDEVDSVPTTGGSSLMRENKMEIKFRACKQDETH